MTHKYCLLLKFLVQVTYLKAYFKTGFLFSRVRTQFLLLLGLDSTKKTITFSS